MLEVIRIYKSIDINSDLINVAKSKCDGLDLNTKASFKAFPPGENYIKIIEKVRTFLENPYAAKAYVLIEPTKGISTKCDYAPSRYYYRIPIVALHYYPD